MSKKKTHNYRQYLDKPMDKVQTIVYIDGEDVKVDIENLLQSFNKLREDVAFLMTEISKIKENLKDNVTIKKVHIQTSGGKSRVSKSQSDVIVKPVIPQPVTEKLNKYEK